MLTTDFRETCGVVPGSVAHSSLHEPAWRTGSYSLLRLKLTPVSPPNLPLRMRLFIDPIPDVRRTADDADSIVFAHGEKANRLNVDQTQLLQVQGNLRPGFFNLCLQFIQMLLFHPPNQPDCCAVTV